jgi:outer membrane receptor protein involved in Fe transport
MLMILFNGKRYITADNHNSMPAYIISNLNYTKQIQIKNINFEASFGINNIFNKNYEIVQFRPMPLRNFSISLNAIF